MGDLSQSWPTSHCYMLLWICRKLKREVMFQTNFPFRTTVLFYSWPLGPDFKIEYT